MSDTSENQSLKEAVRLTKAKSNRLSWALNAYAHLLTAAARKDTSPEARKISKFPDKQVPEHVARLIQDRADPTAAKTMTGWLVKQYAQGALRLEDLGTAYETLDMFNRYARRLPKGQQDLGRYQSLARVWEVVSPIAEVEQDKLSGRAQKAMERDKAYAESRILRQDPDGFTVAVPLTKFAAKWWGKGTRWCTAAKKDNAFLEYHQEAPLIVFVIPELKEKGKFQIWAPKNDFQFMDAADKSVPEHIIDKYWARFSGVFQNEIAQECYILGYVPVRRRTDELCRIAVAKNGQALEYVPRDLCTEEICRMAVAQNGLALQYVPHRLRTDEMFRMAVTQNGRALEYVSEDLRTVEICRIAVAQNGLALWDVPQKLRTEEMCRIAVAQDGYALQYLPSDMRTEEMCRLAVAQNGRALACVPWDLRTEEMCRIAVAQNGQALQYVPQTLRTEEMCSIAVTQNGLALIDVPRDLRTAEMCRIALGQAGWALHYVPEALCTEELCRIALMQNGCALECVPEGRLTEEMCRLAVAQNGLAWEYVPQRLRTEDLCRIAVAQDGGALEHVPEDLQSAMQKFAKPPQPTWDAAILDQWAEAVAPTPPPGISEARRA